MTDTPVQAAQAVKADVAAVHVEAESWLSKHKWPVMLALVSAVLIAVALFVVAPMSVRRRIAGPRSAPAGPRR